MLRRNIGIVSRNGSHSSAWRWNSDSDFSSYLSPNDPSERAIWSKASTTEILYQIFPEVPGFSVKIWTSAFKRWSIIQAILMPQEVYSS